MGHDRPKDEWRLDGARELRDLARGVEGTLVLPDSAAMIRAATDEARSRPLPPVAAFGWALVAMGLCLMDASSVFIVTWMGLGWLPFEPFLYFGVACLGVCLSCLVATLLEARGFRRIRVTQARQIAEMRAASHRTHGYVIGDGGVVELTLGHDGPVRHDHPASEVSEVVMRIEDADHVTLLVRTTGGTIEVPWVERSDAVTDMLGMGRAA